MPQPKKILFFIAGHFPTDTEQAAADKLGTRMFRNASAVTATDESVELAAGYAGLVPASYLAVAKEKKITVYATEETAPPPAETEEPSAPVENDDREPASEPAKKKKKK